MTVELKAEGSVENRILTFLNENASEVLTAKINAGKKTISGALRYATDEAKKLASGAASICVDDNTVFGWIVHYFEEDTVQESKKAAPIRVPSNIAKKPVKQTKQEKPTKPVEPESPQLTMFDALLRGSVA